MTPFPLAIAACHAGQSARADLDAALASEAALYTRGQQVLATKSAADLATMLDDIRAAVYAAQRNNLTGADRIDPTALEATAASLRKVGNGR